MVRAFARGKDGDAHDDKSGRLTRGDAALLRFAAAVTTLESDLWAQYNELGGIQDREVSGGTGNPAYTAALRVLDCDLPQYIHDKTDDEITHHTFLNAYLALKGAATADLEQFRTLPGSKATGSSGKSRLTNLMQLALDMSPLTRCRSSTNLDPTFALRHAIPDLAAGQFASIPRNNADLTPSLRLQTIVNTACFHMLTVEQRANSLYLAMAQKATNEKVLRILISIGATEILHFLTWHDESGNAPPPTDPTKGAAIGAVRFLTAMGLFIGQSPTFFEMLHDLAQDADNATCGGDLNK